MARPRSDQPTPAELEVLKILWERGPSTVREVRQVLVQRRRPRAYTSVMSLLNVMADKGLVDREPEGRAFRYAPRSDREHTLSRLVGDLWSRAFQESASTLVSHLLEEANPSHAELDEIRSLIEAYQEQKGGA
ncbi:MAG: BlaI/MecI/CopY family transcriptional regulator [Planctomycetales bacterium]